MLLQIGIFVNYFFSFLNFVVDKAFLLWYNSRVAKNDPLAQTVEHLTFNQGVRSSSLRRVTKKVVWIQRIHTTFLLTTPPTLNSLQSACGLDLRAVKLLKVKSSLAARVSSESAANLYP